MAESDRRRLITSTPHLNPDEIVQRSFTTSFRGYSEAEVRSFLKRVSEELTVTHEREVELLGTIDELEAQLRSPRPLNESEMLEALGAETTRLLHSARDTADEIRTKAEERAKQLVDDAREEGERITTEAADAARARVDDAEARAAALVSEAEARAVESEAETAAFADEQRERAEQEAETVVDAARVQGRDMLDEAKATRERVLADLARRRSLLQAQVEALRAGRDSLLDAYRVVKHSFLEATNALSQVEERAAAERAAHAGELHEGDDLIAAAAELAPEGDDTQVIDAIADAAAVAGGADVVPEDEETPADAVGPRATPTDAEQAEGDAGLADVDSLFARIRAGQVEKTIVPGAAADLSESSEPGAPPPEPQPDIVLVTEDDAAETPESTDDTPAAAGPEESAGVSRDDWRARRTTVLDPLLGTVAKRAKRAAQDDQNALLDAVRRHKGRPTAAQVLVPDADLKSAWSGVVRDAIDAAYGAGRVAVGADTADADDALVDEAAETIVMPLRERIAAAIDTGEDGDTGGLVERIGARFREWKNQSLEDTLQDVLVLAWSRGVYDGSPDGAVLRWIPVVEGRCADCDDNGLEPTVKGSTFPTGQLHPPAHRGCRCLLAPSDT